MKIAENRINVGHTIAGNPVDLITYTMTAAASGKRLYIQSGMHGGEITYWVQHRLFNFLKEHLLAGEVTFLPFANPLSWEQKSYFYTFGKFNLYDGKDFNSHFPGKENGSLHQRIAYQITQLAKTSDLALDLHTARNSLPYGIYTKEEYAPYIKILGLEYNYLDAGYSPDTDGSFDCAMDPLGIPNICIECGSHDEHDAQKTDEVFQGILRLLAHMKMIDEKLTKPAGDCYYFANLKKIVAQQSGFVRYDVQLNQKFKKGDTLFTMHPTGAFGTEVPEIATEDGLVHKWTPTNIYRIGDDTLHYAPMSEIKKL